MSKKKDNNTIIYSLDNSNFIKSVSAIGLIFHHYAQVMPTSSGVEELFHDMIVGIGYVFSGIFLFSSGYGLAQKTICWKDFYKRIMKLYIPYIITSFLVSALTESGGGIAALKKIITFFAVINDGKFDGLWFIAAIIYFNITYYLSRLICKRKIFYYFINWTALFLWISGCITINAGQWWYNSSACFLLGVKFVDYGDKLKIALDKNRTKILIIFVSILIFIISTYFGGIQKSWIAREVSAIMFCILCYFICAIFDMKSKLLAEYVGKNTLEIYLLHSSILSFLYIHGFCKNGWHVCMAVVLSLAMSYMVGKVNQRAVRLVTRC